MASKLPVFFNGVRINSQQSAGRKHQSGCQKIKYSSKGREKGEKDLRKKIAKDVRGKNTRTKILIHTYWGEITVCGTLLPNTNVRTEEGSFWMYKSLWLC